jgi:hypothetical protein
MREIIAEQLEHDTEAIIGARTVRGTAAECLLVGNEIVVGIDSGQISIRVSERLSEGEGLRGWEIDRVTFGSRWKRHICGRGGQPAATECS